MKYENCQQHIFDELQRLQLLIQTQFLKLRKNIGKHPYEEFEKLILSDKEIDALLINADSDAPEDSKFLECLELINRLEEKIFQNVEESLNDGIYLPIYRLMELFNLTSFEKDCIIICLAPELDLRYEKLYAFLQNDITRKYATVDLVLELLCRNFEEKLASREFFLPESPLIQYRLIEIHNEGIDRELPLLSRSLKLDDAIINFLLGRTSIDSRLLPFISWGDSNIQWHKAEAIEEMKSRLRILLDKYLADEITNTSEHYVESGIVFSFEGSPRTGKRSTAEALCGEFNIPLLIINTQRLLQNGVNFENAVHIIIREAIIHNSAMYWDNFNLIPIGSNHYDIIIENLKRFSGIVFLDNCNNWKPIESFDDRLFIRIEFPMPPYSIRKSLFENELHNIINSESEIAELANKFNLGQTQIHSAVIIAQNLACLRDPENSSITIEDITSACRAQSNQELRNFSQKIQPLYTWKDIVLPEDTIAQLHELCNAVRYRGLIQDTWGFGKKISSGHGITALFAGPSGTGKTMSAEVIANDLGLELYKIDLSSVISKYIGETEKNLDAIFRAADIDSNAIIFFDEADALFGKRSEIRDSHDRYANIEISYLLQKMESYNGVAILASNMRQHLDEAFLRRLAYTIIFPFPDETCRRRIWETIWTSETPLSKDIDLDYMTRQFNLSGGNIKNIALASAFLAASDGGVITMQHLIRATQREYQKMGKILNTKDLGNYSG